MKLAHFARKIEQNDPLHLKGLKTRIALVLLLSFLFAVADPAALLPGLPVVLGAVLLSTLFNAAWIAWNKGVRYRLPVVVTMDVLVVTYAVYCIGGPENQFPWLYALFIVPFVVFSGARIGLLATTLSSIFYSLLLTAELRGIIPPYQGLHAFNSVSISLDAAYLSGKLLGDNMLFWITFLGTLYIKNISARKSEELKKANDEAHKTKATLEAYTSDLERTVSERTASLTRTNEQLRAEIAERENVEKALRESKERYRMLVEEATDIICTVDMKTGVITSANAYAAKALGYRLDEVLNKLSFIELVHPDDQENVFNHLREFTLKKALTPNYPLRLRKADGTHVHVEVNGAVTYDHEGHPETFIGVLRDVTERKRAEEALRESEIRYKTLVDNSFTCICLIQDGRFKFANRPLLEISGYSSDELIEMPFLDLVHPDDRDYVMELERRRLSGLGVDTRHRYRAVDKSGKVLWIETFARVVEHQSKPAMLVDLIDITERQHAEEALRNSEERLKILFEYAPDAYYLHDLNGIFIDGNRAAEHLIGYRREELVGNSVMKLNILAADQVEKAGRIISENARGNASFDELVLKKKDGGTVTVEIRTFPIKIADQPLVLGIARDVTERKRANELLRQSEEKYRTLLDLFEVGFYETDLAGNLLFFNETIRKYLGYPKEKLLGLHYHSYVNEDDARIMYRSFNKVYKTGEADKGFVCNVITEKGTTTPVEFSVSLVRDEDGAPIGFRGVTRDITQRKQAEEQLRKSEEKYRSLFEESKDVIYITAPNGEILDVNPAGVQLFGVSRKEKILNHDIFGYFRFNPGDREKLAKNFERTGFVKDFELNITDKRGRPLNLLLTASRVLDDAGNIAAYRGILRDVTEKKQLEQQLFQAQKMESIGTLAGGIAHDFNNLLGGILGYASFLKSKIDRDHPFYGYVDTIERSGMRAAELTSQLLGFARGGKYDTKAVDLNIIVQETMKIITRTFDKSIEIESHLGENLATVEADAAQIQQVLMNLCVNAHDAMPLGGKLVIETELAHLLDDFVRMNLGAKAGPYVTLSVSDTGIGMDAETLKRIFEPFFTTKEKGKGTGLGLAMVYGVIKNHGGFIRVYSEPGTGSIFRVYLPANGKPESREVFDIETPRGGRETILIVDDEEAIRSLAKDTLETNGYTVLLAEDGLDAIEMYQNSSDRIALVILDMVMPKIGGRETFLRMKEINPAVKALLSTGYSQNGKAKEILESGVAGFIQKPYQIKELLTKVRSVLDLSK